MRVLLQLVEKPHPALTGVPLTKDVMKTDEGRQVMKTVIHDIGGSLNRPYSLPPGTPRDRVMILRRGFDAAMKDPELLAEAKKARFDISAVSGEKVERLVANIGKLPPELMATIKKTFAPKK